METVKLNDSTIACIGAGNMAEALLKGWLSEGVCAPDCIRVADIRNERCIELADRYGIVIAEGNVKAVEGADIVLLSVKPQVMDEVLAELSPILTDAMLVISIAAGLPLEHFERRLPHGRIVRVMPNTPALVGEGASAYCPGRGADEADAAAVETLLGSVGVVRRVDEAHMDAVTALSGSGPAYVFVLLDALLTAAAEMGLPDADARVLAAATVKGAACLFEASDDAPEAFIQRVASKGGTTEAALKVLESHGVKAAWVEAVQAACKRAAEMSRS